MEFLWVGNVYVDRLQRLNVGLSMVKFTIIETNLTFRRLQREKRFMKFGDSFACNFLNFIAAGQKNKRLQSLHSLMSAWARVADPLHFGL